MVEKWTALFSSIVEKHAPIRDIRVSDRNCPWVNADLKALMKSRDRLKNAEVSTKSETLLRSCREARNRVNSLDNCLKKKFYNNRISQHRGNMRETWKIANDLLKKEVNTPISTLLTIETSKL